MGPNDSFINACFLGAYAENNELFERLLVESLRDHIYWRRNFHPEDPPPIPPFAEQDPAYSQFVARLRHELQLLTARLKRSLPFSSPRYMGHMVSDPLLPGLLAQMIALPYNPNHVSAEAAPATIDLEIDVGLQLAAMLGFPNDETRPDCAFGHLTSGGTVANYESLWILRAIKFFPLALQSAGLPPLRELSVRGQPLETHDSWSLLNLSVPEVIDLAAKAQAALQGRDPTRQQAWMGRMQSARLEHLGLVEFHRQHPELKPPVVFAPETAHYSWRKAMKLLGLGAHQLRKIPTRGMRLDTHALSQSLAQCRHDKTPVLAVIAILGTTEYGTLDPVHELIALRKRCEKDGFTFGIHVDAAWGGYVTSLFRNEDGSFRSHQDIRADFAKFPSKRVYDTFAALSEADSVTVDPHKLGYLPYGAGGAYVCRDHRMAEFVTERAPYVFPDEAPSEKLDYRNRFRELGRYILEGSKPGAAAAAVYVTHRTLPLDYAHFGRLVHLSIAAAEHFCDRLGELAKSLRDTVRIVIPFEPDTNLVCVAFNPVGNRSASQMNAFSRRIYDHLRPDRERPLQAQSFFSSSTLLYPSLLGATERRRILYALGLSTDRRTDTTLDADALFVLRHTLMNPWLQDEVNHIDYIDAYCQHLGSLLQHEVALLDVAPRMAEVKVAGSSAARKRR